jgi:hypothetical protein
MQGNLFLKANEIFFQYKKYCITLYIFNEISKTLKKKNVKVENSDSHYLELLLLLINRKKKKKLKITGLNDTGKRNYKIKIKKIVFKSRK